MTRSSPIVILPLAAALVAVGAFVSACKDEAPKKAQGDVPAPVQGGQAAVIPVGLIARGDLPIAPNLGEVMKSAKVGEKVRFAARIAGRADPFLEGQAVMIVSDPALVPCNEKEGDTCPTPADLCCESRETLLVNTATVQVPGSNGKPIAATLAGAQGLKQLEHVVIEGTLVERGDKGGFVVNATKVSVGPKPASAAKPKT